MKVAVEIGRRISEERETASVSSYSLSKHSDSEATAGRELLGERWR